MKALIALRSTRRVFVLEHFVQPEHLVMKCQQHIYPVGIGLVIEGRVLAVRPFRLPRLDGPLSGLEKLPESVARSVGGRQRWGEIFRETGRNLGPQFVICDAVEHTLAYVQGEDLLLQLVVPLEKLRIRRARCLVSKRPLGPKVPPKRDSQLGGAIGGHSSGSL
jgi:hypothetical protein